MLSSARAAPAKLNLSLHVLGKRTDDYHTLHSLIAFADIADRLEAAPADTLSLNVHGPFAAAAGDVEDNLVLRAARALQRAGGNSTGARLTLEKHIPAGAGFGGGSSDAAAALKLLNTLWGLKLSEAELATIGAQIGADVPMCVHARPLIAEGIGEKITPLEKPLPLLYAVLAWPGKPLATEAVFKICKPMATVASLGAWHDAASFLRALNAMRNDLEAPAIALLPAIGELLAALREGGEACVRMSGSGSGCYALTADAAGAQILAASLKTKFPDYWVKATEIIPYPPRP